jgi:hypothetical protein
MINNKIYEWFVLLFLQKTRFEVKHTHFMRTQFVSIDWLVFCGFDSYEDSIKDTLIILRRDYEH